MKALIVDDESRSRENLRLLLTQYCDVEVIAEAASARAAIEHLAASTPNVLFLDVQMPGMNGIELARKVSHRHIPVVFVTAYDHYALQALKASAVDYLLKPTRILDLRNAVEKVRMRSHRENREREADAQALDTLSVNLHAREGLRKMILPWEGGFKVINIGEVSRISSDNTYSELFLDERRIVVSKSIGELENLLQDSSFYRVHYQHMINLAHLDTFTSKDGGQAVMKDGCIIPVSRRRLPGFKKAAQAFFHPG